MPKKANTIDEYISTFPIDIQQILQKIRENIRKCIPTAEETISYSIPTFKIKTNLVHFAAFKKHIGFYPTPSVIEAYKSQLTSYEVSKGAIKFPLDQPIPYPLIEKMVRYRLKEIQEKSHNS